MTSQMKRAALALAAMMGLVSMAGAAPLTIVDDGKGLATIVVATNEAKATTAAKELQTYVEKMSGAKLPIVTEGTAVTTPVTILIGHTAGAAKLGVKIPAGFNSSIRPDYGEEESYVLKTVGNNLIVGGNSDGPYQGTIYAANNLLERLGCRWYFPGDFGEVVPEKKTLAVPDLNVSTKPDFAVRNIWIDGRWGLSWPERAVYAAWSSRIGFGGEALYPMPGDGFLAEPLPPNQYAKEHPEWYAMNQKGVRDITPQSGDRLSMLCLSNGQMFDGYVKNVREAFEGKRKIQCVTSSGIAISPPDGAPYCYCDKCLAASQGFFYPTYVQEKMQCEEVAGFAAKLADLFPDKWVVMAGYSLREAPPQGVKFRANMGVMYAPIPTCVLHPGNDPHCWRREETLEILTEWRRQTPHVWLYDYTPALLVSQFEPEPDVSNFAINAGLYKKTGIKGFNRQGSNAMMSTWLGYYSAAKFMWDAQADVNAIKKDFYETFFGPEAGPHVQAWWDACENALHAATIHVHEAWLLNHIYTADFAHSIHKHLEAAQKSKMTDKQRARVKVFALIVENFEANCDMEEAGKNLDYKKAADCAQRMLTARDAISKVSVFLIGPAAQTVTAYGVYTKGRQDVYLKLAAETDGEKGTMVAPLPIETKFSRDPYNHGVFARWYAPEFNDSQWKMENTFFCWDQQDPPEDAVGHDYDGYGWYRTTVDIPASFKGKPIHFYSGGAMNEAWVWVNGEYVGHRPNQLWWMGNLDFDMDVSKQVRTGQKNTLTIRILNDTQFGGLIRRGFFWSPKPEPVVTSQK